eukprot:TRINITY_DN24878_c0_g1_i1.p1 TRINITY_DN24878_c0_g1~~TRINITY_DN24878_c0_g1_i1.p1  ORF type:complete len:131 (+),score=45.46 TRINITY_DN24878_c0_g1_i1:103-495(+)
MSDNDRIAVKCDVVTDYAVQTRKNLRKKKQYQLILSRDDWGSIILKMQSKSGSKTSYKLENNVRNVYSDFMDKGRATIELQSPHVFILISSAVLDELLPFIGIVQRLKDDPDAAESLELYKGELDEEPDA